MTSSDIEALLGDTLIQFSTDGRFPEEEATSAAYIENSALPGALKALTDAQTELEVSPLLGGLLLDQLSTAVFNS
jgi:centromere/kinetochore protein ZW10